MNNYRIKLYFKLFVFTLFFYLSCGLQTSFWPHVVTFIPSPQIWLILIFFITLRWTSIYTIFFIYFLGYCLTFFSNLPLKMLWTCLLICFTVIWTTKNRVRLTGVSSFLFFTFFGSLIFEASYYNLSSLLESNRSTELLFFDRALQILVNFIFAYPTFVALNHLDRFLLDEDDWKTSRNQPQVDGGINE